MSETDAIRNSEPGLLTRVRSLRDLFPWLALGDSLGPATSVIATILSLIAMVLTDVGHSWLGITSFRNETHFSTMGIGDGYLPLGSFISALGYFVLPLRTIGADPISLASLLKLLAAQLWLWFVWCLPAAYIMRRTVLVVGGKTPMATDATLRMGIQRMSAMLGAPLLLLLGVSLVSVAYFVVGWLSQIPMLGWIASIGIYPFAIGAGLLIAGLYAGLLLMWASAVTEEFADTFDIASRGFEYLMQRPLRTVMYAAMATLVSAIMITIMKWIVGAGTVIARESVQFANPDASVRAMGWLAEHLVAAYSINLALALAAVIYLLLRRDANHQEMEEIWEPQLSVSNPLPTLEFDANGVPKPPSN